MRGGLKKTCEAEAQRLGREFAAWAALFNGLKLDGGRIITAEKDCASYFLYKAGLLGGELAIERELETELREEMNADMSDGAARYYELSSSTDLSTVEILEKIEVEFSTTVMKHVKYTADCLDAMDEYRELMASSDMDNAKALAKLEQQYTKGVIGWLSSATSTSAAMAGYDKLVAKCVDRDAALAELRKTFDVNTMSWLLSILSKVDCTNKNLGLETTNNPDEIIVVTCPKCGEKESTNQIYVDKDGTRLSVIPTCRRLTAGGKRCYRNMDADTDSTTPTIQRRALEKRMVSIYNYPCV